MTLIVDPAVFTSKAALKEALDKGEVMLTDPSFVNPWKKPAKALSMGFRGVVTNHPKRSKFAEIERTGKGWVVK